MTTNLSKGVVLCLLVLSCIRNQPKINPSGAHVAIQSEVQKIGECLTDAITQNNDVQVQECLLALEKFSKEEEEKLLSRLLKEAARKGQINTLQRLLELGADREARDDRGYTPLHNAIRWGKIGIVQRLLEHGADREARDGLGYTPLHNAIRWGNIETVQRLLEHGADREAKDDNGNTPLHVAAASGSSEIFVLLLENGASINSKNKQKETFLYIAIQNNNYHIVEALFNFINQKEREEIVEKLVPTSRDPKEVEDMKKQWESLPPLLVQKIVQASKMHLTWLPLFSNKTVELLLNKKQCKETDELIARLSQYDRIEISRLLHRAAKNDNTKIVLDLLAEGADREARDGLGYTPLHNAIRWGNIETVQRLLELGADREAKDNFGYTPLHNAIRWGNREIVEIVQLLLAKGADREAKANNGYTPLSLAKQFRRDAIVALLTGQ